MKKTLLFAAAATLSIALNAKVLLVENFDYTAGTPLTDCGWISAYGGTSATSVSNGLNFEGYAGCGIGNGALINGKDGSNQPHKAFEAQTSGTPIYIAFMLNPYMVSKASYFLCLRDAASATTFNFNARVFLNVQNQIGLSYCGGVNEAQFADKILDNETTYLVVLKYIPVSGAKNDEIALYVLDTFAATEPASPLLKTANTASGKNDDIYPENVVLRSNSADDWISVDGIRIATTWSEAVAAGNCPTTAITQPDNDKMAFYTEHNALTIELQHSDKVAIFDATGKCVYQDNLPVGTHRFELQNGFYVLKTTAQTHKVAVH